MGAGQSHLNSERAKMAVQAPIAAQKRAAHPCFRTAGSQNALSQRVFGSQMAQMTVSGTVKDLDAIALSMGVDTIPHLWYTGLVD